jgi:two-component system NtrC family sensor kinase
MAGGGRRKARPATPLKTSEEFATVYAAVVASALDAVIVVDETGLVVSMNAAAEATFGYPAAEALGRSIGALIVPDHLLAAHEHGMARYRATREPHVLGRRVEMEARRKDGRLIPVELAITEVILPDRRLFTAHLRDLSAARQAAAEIERQRDALHQSEKLAALGSLLAGVAHELNNPLSIVLGQAIMMREDAGEVENAAGLCDRAAIIEAAADRCGRIIRSFLAIARQRKAERKAFPIPAALDDAIDLQMYGLRSRGIVLTRDYEEALPQALADPDHVQQIIANLLVNALHAQEGLQGHREIRVSARKGSDGVVSLVVADNGPGVPTELVGRIFDPFFTTKPRGTGIGLSVSRGLAEAQGGTLTLCRSPLGGAALELTLPSAAPADAVLPEVNGPTGAGAKVQTIIESAPRTAVIVDDEAEIALLIAEPLRREGYVCAIAASGREAQALIDARASNFDAVICDLRMPDMDGPALFSWMEAHHPGLTERVLFVTGDALGPTAGRFLAASGRPVLEKPFAPADVARLVVGFPPAGRL